MSLIRITWLRRISSALILAAFLSTTAANVGCGGAIANSGHPSGDPLHLGVTPGPQGSTDPQIIELRLGGEPSDRIVSVSLTISSLKATNSGNEDLELLTAPRTVEFTHSAIVTEPVVIREIYQDTYSTLIFPDMTGQVVFFDSNGQLAAQALSIPAQTITLSPSVTLGSTPQVVSASLDLAQTFAVGSSSVTVNPLVVTASSATPAPPVAPAIGQPETGNISFMVGTVTAVDTNNHTISLQPSSGEAVQIAYDNAGGTEFVDCDPSMLTGMMVEVESGTRASGTVLASMVSLVGPSASSSELYGLLGGYAPDAIDYNLIVAGGAGLNTSSSLIGKNVTLDWLAASYSVNTAHLGLDLITDDDLVFDETHAFPGQFVAVSGDSLLVPDPDGANAGFMQPRMFELEEQTLTGQVFGYVYHAETQTGTFTLAVASDSMIKTLNGGLLSITVRQLPQTYLRNNPTFVDGDFVKVRGLLFAGSQYSNTNYQPPASPVAFIFVADRISK